MSIFRSPVSASKRSCTLPVDNSLGGALNEHFGSIEQVVGGGDPLGCTVHRHGLPVPTELQSEFLLVLLPDHTVARMASTKR